jgi:predicted TIM-barrel fold metal-dependent hydrolase
MPDLSFFDANCQVGHYNFRIEGGPYAMPDLLADMQAQAIAQRLVYHAMARESNPDLGNAALMQELEGLSELVPCWTVSTWTTGEMDPPAEFAGQLRAGAMRAVRFFRYAYTVSPAEWAMGPLWSALEWYRVPLFLDLSQRWATIDPIDAEEIYALCHAHPNLPVVLVKHRIRYNRQVYQLFEACPNLRMELSGYWHYRAVEEICGRFGDYRLLFGTNWPFMDSSFAVAAVTYAEVTDATKAAVGGGNLRARLEAVHW